ncbi:MAG: hypothetical protein GX825_01055 [Syntrophomonadaceae bacterium]|nr:hypothetical protein [Syntrophomonadaceae bacterium]
MRTIRATPIKKQLIKEGQRERQLLLVVMIESLADIPILSTKSMIRVKSLKEMAARSSIFTIRVNLTR